MRRLLLRWLVGHKWPRTQNNGNASTHYCHQQPKTDVNYNLFLHKNLLLYASFLIKLHRYIPQTMWGVLYNIRTKMAADVGIYAVFLAVVDAFVRKKTTTAMCSGILIY